MQLLSGMSGVSRVKKYNCIICQKKCSTKQGLASHFRTHKALPFNYMCNQRLTPYADPSCWPGKDLTWESINDFKKTERDLEMEKPNTEAPSVIWEQWNEASRLARVQAATTKEADAYDEVQDLRIWNWWYHAQLAADGGDTDDDRLQRMLENHGGHFGIVDDAGARDRASRLRLNTFHEAIQIPDQPAVEDDNKSISIKTGPFKSTIRPDHEEHWRLWRERGVNGRLVADIELPLRGPLNPEAIIQCLSEATTAFAAKQGETKEARAQLGNAVAEYLDKISQHYDDNNNNVEAAKSKVKYALANLPHHDWRATHDISSMGPAEITTRTTREEQWYAQAFRDVRAVFFDILTGVTDIYFKDFDREQFSRGNVHFDRVLQATEAYAAALGDTDVKQKLDLYRTTNGNGWRSELNRKYGWGKR